MDRNKICRCCLAKGATKDLSTSYTFIEKEEIYSEMLQECFNIVLSPRANNNCICEVCVKNLRDSFYFKQQVLKAEQAFLIRLSCEEQDKKPQVKTEPEPEPELEPDPEQSDCDSDNIADAIKEESPDDATDPITQTETIPETEQTTIQKTEDDHWEIPVFETKLTTNSEKLPTMKISKQKSSTKKENEKKSPADITWVKKSIADKQKHRDNLLTVLKYSNVVPFRHKNLLGFVCGYCDATYPDPLDLRSHTEKEHEKERFLLKSSFDMTEFSVKLDITDLICKICATKMDNLNKLKDHLVNKHNKKIHNDIKDHLMQFKLKKGDIYDCVMCPSTYETFKMLKQHMNKHYDNYSCNKCENSFATKRSLNAHRGTHKEGSFKCDLCEKVFMSRTKKHYHEKIQHMGTRNISNCMLCDTPFRSYYQRNQHMIKVHNSEAQYKCNVCDKVYVLKSLLMCHIKKSHLMEKNCQCTECGYKFFSNKALKAHMVKHTGEKNYACEVCHKSYARKYTLREHMRIHNNDRRFRCAVCATSFVQKCSLKSHLLSHHGISLAASDIVSIS